MPLKFGEQLVAAARRFPEEVGPFCIGTYKSSTTLDTSHRMGGDSSRRTRLLSTGQFG